MPMGGVDGRPRRPDTPVLSAGRQVRAMTEGAFTYNGGRVDPGERADIRYSISETYLGDPV
ncbi:MAG: hypothetical protein ACOCQL_00175, partial [Halolamina sp.]